MTVDYDLSPRVPQAKKRCQKTCLFENKVVILQRENNKKTLTMKKIFSILAIAVLLLTMACNKNKSCSFAMEYNSDTKQCECVQEVIKEYVKPLDTTGYNSCNTLWDNLIYFSVDNKEYPYYSYEGDTIRVYGYISHYQNSSVFFSSDSAFFKICVLSDSTEAMFPEQIDDGCYTKVISCYGDDNQINNILLDEKCFITGVLSFSNPPFGTYSDIIKGTCSSAPYHLNITEIHN